MTVLTSLEKRRAYNRLYERNRRCAHDARFNIRVDPKRVTLEYPGCGYPDKMSLWEYKKLDPRDFPEGTKIFLDGQEIGMQMELKLEETK